MNGKMRTDLGKGFAYIVNRIVDTSDRHSRVDIRVGAGRRCRWRDEEKSRIVSESYAPGAIVSEVARPHEISPQRLFAWRTHWTLVLPSGAGPMFVPAGL
jgi:transposase